MFHLSKRTEKHKHIRVAKLFAVGAALVLTAGCATTQDSAPELIAPDAGIGAGSAAGLSSAPVALNTSERPEAIDPTLRVVAVDLVSVLAQLPGYEAWSLTAQVSPATSSFGEELIGVMRKAGYGVQRVSADQGRNYLEYSKNVTLTNDSESTAFEIRVRDVSVSRNYQWIGSRWIPSSPVRIEGIKPTTVNVYNDLHGKEGITTKLVTGVQFVDNSGRIVSSQASIQRISGNPSDQVEEQNVLNMSRASVFSRQRSNDDLRTYRPVSVVTLTFPSNNPNVLGELNKQAISSILEQMDASSDRFVIQGCSRGQSLAWDGTEVLSLERQQRVNTELLVAGVKAESIQETDCFQTAKNLPRQSVLLTLQRATQPL